MSQRDGLRAGSRRIVWIVADQGISSLINLGVAVFAARTLPPEAFGGFSLVFAAYLLGLGTSRAVATGPLGIRFSTVSQQAWNEATAASSASSLLIGLAASPLLVFPALLLWGPGSPTGGGMCALALVLPAVLVQDQWRFAFIALGQPRHAFTTNAIWAASIVATLGAIAAMDVVHTWTIILAWGSAAFVAAVSGAVKAGIAPRVSTSLQWLRSHIDLTPSLVGDFLLSAGVTQALAFGVALVGGITATGALRGAQVMFGPVNVIVMAASAAAVAEGSRLLASAPRYFLLGMAGVSGGVAIIALAWGLATSSLLPDAIGEEVLGQTWAKAQPVLPALTVLMGASGAATGALAGLRALELPQRTVKVRAFGAPLLLLGGILGASANGAPGAVWGQCGPMIALAMAWWVQLIHAVRDPRREA